MNEKEVKENYEAERDSLKCELNECRKRMKKLCDENERLENHKGR